MNFEIGIKDPDKYFNLPDYCVEAEVKVSNKQGKVKGRGIVFLYKTKIKNITEQNKTKQKIESRHFEKKYTCRLYHRCNKVFCCVYISKTSFS